MPCADYMTVYPFSWLDELIEVQMNAASAGFCEPSSAELQQISSQLATQIEQLYVQLKTGTFPVFPAENVGAIARRYLENLQQLYLQASENLAACPASSALSEASEDVLLRLDTLRRRIEKRYGAYLVGSAGRDGAGNKS